MQEIARYYPIVTTIFSFIIAREMFVEYREQKLTYLLCWALGVCSFGLAALAASINVLAGWTPANLKFWYITGALVGGFPLAQGILYALAKRKAADVLTVVFLVVIMVGAVAVSLTPISLPPGFDNELTGKVFSWKWVRFFSPVVNLYSFLIVLGGGIYAAYRYYLRDDKDELFLATAIIATGGLLPGFGDIFMRMGYVSVLFVLYFLSLALIYSGFRILNSSNL